jgi:hypothetical protein
MPKARARRDFAADAPEPDHAEHLAPEFRAHEAFLVPHALFHRGIGGGNRPRHRQHQSERELGDADAVGAGGVHHQDAARGGGGHVDVVDAGAGARDDAKPGRRGDQLFGDLRRAADDECVGIGEIAREFVGLASGFGVDRPSGGAKRVGGGGRERIGDDDVHARL